MPQKFTTTSPSGHEYGWDVDRLWKLSAHLPIVSVPIESFPLETWVDSTVRNAFKKKNKNAPMTLDDFVQLRMDKYINKPDDQYDLPRVRNASLDYPILINQYGVIMDGYHRFIKAYFSGAKTILTRRFITDPEPDFVWSKNKEIPWKEWQAAHNPAATGMPPSVAWK